MLQQLIELEDRFQPHLRPGDYSFIGPVNQELLTPFLKRANDLAPIVAIFRSLHHAMSHKGATRQALDIFPAGTPLRIYVITRTNRDVLLHGTIEEYCQKNSIDFQP